VDIAPSYGLFIDGEFAEAADGKVFKTVSPSSEEVLSEVAQAGAEDVDRAVKAARKAFTSWSALPGAERGKYLFPYRPHHPGALARIRRPGIPGQRQSRSARPATSTCRSSPRTSSTYAGLGRQAQVRGLRPDPSPSASPAKIIPWNFPLLMLAGRSPRPSPPATRWS